MSHYQVIVIGGGVAGLRCAHELVHRKGITDVLVVEAQNRLGGRILSESTFIPGMNVEIGAEIAHGDNTTLTKLAKDEKWNLREIFTWAQGDGGPSAMAPDGGIGYYYLGDQKRLLAYDDKDPDFCQFNEAVKNLAEIEEKQNISIHDIPLDKSVHDYFENDCNLSPSMMKLAEAGYANTAGGSMNDISLFITCKYEKQWIELEDEGDFRIQPNFTCVIETLQRDIMRKLEWPVQTINYSDISTPIRITSVYGEELSCDRLVVTTPTSVFQNIEYIPQLPPKKIQAVKSFGMRSAIKILLQFKESFWPENTHGVICSDCFVPEFWVNHSDGVGALIKNQEVVDDKSTANRERQYLVTGFAAADSADRLQTIEEDEIIARFLEQLDSIYATEENSQPATTVFVKGKYVDWSKFKYIEGGYSYPRIGQNDSAAKDLAESIENRIFFAGEATSYEQPGMSVHSSLDTGTRSAEEVAQSLKE